MELSQQLHWNFNGAVGTITITVFPVTTTGYYRKDSLKLAAHCPVSGCWPSCFTSAKEGYVFVIVCLIFLPFSFSVGVGKICDFRQAADYTPKMV